MITAMLFDLDGTLVQTERLKARSYARAAVELCPREISEEEVVEAFKDVVGLSRREVAEALVERFGLEEKAAVEAAQHGVEEAWEGFVRLRLKRYEEMIADPIVLRSNQWPHNVRLLQAARRAGCKTALATMSSGQQARRVLAALDLAGAFDVVASRDDVQRGKPDPEIYQLCAAMLEVAPSQCLVIEDSPIGIEAGLRAGMEVVAVSTPFTKERLHRMDALPASRLVDEPEDLLQLVETIVGSGRI